MSPNHDPQPKATNERNMGRFATALALCLVLVTACAAREIASERTPGPPQASPIAEPLPTITSVAAALLATKTVPPTQPEVTETTTLVNVLITSDFPDAEIYLDGILQGVTPYTATLAAGIPVTVTVTLPGLHPWEQHVTPQLGEPQHLVADFSFTPQLEELVDDCIQAAWWGEGAQTIFFLRCPSDQEQGLWKLDLATREVELIEAGQPRARVPMHLQPFIPVQVNDYFVSASPTGKRVVYLEQIDPYLNQPTPTPPADPGGFGELPFSFEYRVVLIDESGKMVELGQIEGDADSMSWSEDERLFFIATSIYDGDAPAGWLFNLEEMAVKTLTPPLYGDEELAPSKFCNASLQPNGEGIMYRPCLFEPLPPYLLWNYTTGELQELVTQGGYVWLEGSRYLLFSDQEGLFWYDIVTDRLELISTDITGAFSDILFQQLSPERNRIIFTRPVATGIRRGLWMLTLDTE